MEIAFGLLEEHDRAVPGLKSKLLPLFEWREGDPVPALAPRTTAAARRAPRPRAAPRRPRTMPETSEYHTLKTSSTHFAHINSAPQLQMPDASIDTGFENESLLHEAIDTASMMVEEEREAWEEYGSPVNNLSMLHHFHVVLDFWIDGGLDGVMKAINALPEEFPINDVSDQEGCNLLHWAFSMGHPEAAKLIIDRGGDVTKKTDNDETCLIRACLFTNCYERHVFDHMLKYCMELLLAKDFFNAGIFHHLAHASRTTSKRRAIRFYAQALVKTIRDLYGDQKLEEILMWKDDNDSTAVLIAAKMGCPRLAGFYLLHASRAALVRDLEGDCAADMLKLHELTRNRGTGVHSPDWDSPSDFSEEEVLDRDNQELFDNFRELVNFRESVDAKLDVKLETTEQTAKELQQFISQLRLQAIVVGQNLENTKYCQPVDTAEYDSNYMELERTEETIENLRELAKLNSLSPLATKTASAINSQHDLDDRIAKYGELIAAQKIRIDSSKQAIRSAITAGADKTLASFRFLVSSAVGMKEEDMDEYVADVLENLEAAGPQVLPEFKNGEFKVEH